MTKRKKIVIAVAAVLLCVILGVVAYLVSILSGLKTVDLTDNDSDLGIESEYDPVPDDHAKTVTNIALFGLDSRGTNDKGRSDSIMILTVDKAHDKIKVSSLMRDTYLDIEGTSSKKLNAAYSKGGPQLAIKTINQNFEMNIRNYATVDFDGMAKIIDAVGGIEIDITESERKNANESIEEQAEILNVKPDFIKKSGLQTLNGMQAVGYARIRYIGNADFERTERQRRVMEQLFQKALKMNVLEYPNFIKELLPIVETSMGYNDLIDLASIMTRPNLKFEQGRFPCDADIENAGFTYNGESHVKCDLKKTSLRLRRFIYDDIDPETELSQKDLSSIKSSSKSSQSSAEKNSSSKKTSSKASSSKTTSTKTSSSTR